MGFIRTAAGLLATLVLGLSYLLALAVLVFGTWWAIRAFIAGAVGQGLLILFFTAPATAIAQGLVGLLAVPLAALAQSAPPERPVAPEPFDGR